MQSGAFVLIVLVITQFLYTAYLLGRVQEYMAPIARRYESVTADLS
jgi:hypothetical protein